MDSAISKILVLLSTSFFVLKVLSCNLPKSERFPCGDNVKSRNECLGLNCCYDNKHSADDSPKCYFRRRDAAGGPIKHSTGLCLYPQNGSTKDNTSLIWSYNCSSKHSMFLVAHNRSTYHLASGKCIMPRNGMPANPGIGSSLVLGGSDCGSDLVRFQAVENGNLAYHYQWFSQKICIGEGEKRRNPSENDLVKISQRACKQDDGQQHLKYVYEKRSRQATVERLSCPGNADMQVTWAHYGQPNDKPKCLTNATRIIEKKCNRMSYCYFEVDDNFFEVDCPNVKKSLLVRYTCNWNTNSSVKPSSQLGKNVSLTKFEIRLEKLEYVEKYIQIILIKLQSDELPATRPEWYNPSYLKPWTKHRAPNKPYITANLSQKYVNTHAWFTVGDGQNYGNYIEKASGRHVPFVNAALHPGTNYSYFIRTFRGNNSYHDTDWMKVIQTKNEDIQVTESRNCNCDEEIMRNFIKSWKDFIFIGIIVFQFLINIFLVSLIFCKICKRKQKDSEKGKAAEDGEELSMKAETDFSTKVESKPDRVSHQYEYPNIGCRRQCDHNNMASGYEELRPQTGTEYEHAYHSLRTL